jgi:hypothetical protein
VTLAAFLSPVGFGLLLAWCFMVLSAVQLTIRLIMAFSVRRTALGALVLALLALPIALVYDLAVAPQPSLAARLEWAPLPMSLMALAGYFTARAVLGFKRTRGQVIAGIMVGLLDPHLFTLLPVA